MYIPRFCPNKHCTKHTVNNQSADWFYKFGTYLTESFGYVQRFRCKDCLKTFSKQTFHLDYYAKKVLPYYTLMQQATSSMSIRALSRFHNCTTATILNKLERLSHQAIALHNKLKTNIVLKEPLVADGFESFSVSQYFPNNITLLAGKRSQFIYHFNHITIRRKGRMTDKQKKLKKVLYKQADFERKGIEKRFTELLGEIISLNKQEKHSKVMLYTDEKPDYERSIKHLAPDKLALTHIKVNSQKKRTKQNNLFAVNYLDRELRKDLAEHRRETVCFGRNVCQSMNRLAVYMLYHNYFKPYRIKNDVSDMPTHAEVAGVTSSLLLKEKTGLFEERYFLSHLEITNSMKTLWCKKLVTPLKVKTEKVPQYALN